MHVAKEKLAFCIASGMTTAKAALEAGIPVITAERWKSKTEFMLRRDELRAKLTVTYVDASVPYILSELDKNAKKAAEKAAAAPPPTPAKPKAKAPAAPAAPKKAAEKTFSSSSSSSSPPPKKKLLVE
jgi:hypothetical protein